jgi:glycerophosphoryl diester phosphodiesterase
MLIYAHRGLSGRFPENTLLAFREALAAGVDGIELDVHVGSDGIPVVIHDRDVSRTTNGSGYVDEMPLASLQALDAGDGERVPTLTEVLELVGSSVHLDVEIKGLGAERATLGALAGFPGARWAISSFNWSILRELRRLGSGAELWPLAERVDNALFAIAAELGSPAVSLWTDAYTEESAPSLPKAGLRTVVWTVNDRQEAERVRELGAYAICTDDPKRVVRAASEHANPATRKG